MSAEQKPRYDFKMLLGDILVFRAHLIDEETYYFLEVEHFGIDESYKQLFLEIIKGEFALKYYDNEDINDRVLPDSTKELNISGNTLFERLENAKELLESLFGLTAVYEETSLNDMIMFRYDGHDLNIAYGLNPKSAADVYSISNNLIKAVAANNTNFGEVLQMKEFASSTVIPYQSEKVDEPVLHIIIKAINDINKKAIDSTFAHSQEMYANVYKKFIQKLKDVRKLKELKTFEVIIGQKAYALEDLDYLKKIDEQLFNDTISGVATIHHVEKFLTSRENIYSVVVQYDGKNIKFHFDKNLPDFEQMLHVVKENDEKDVRFEGTKIKEETILVSQLSKL